MRLWFKVMAGYGVVMVIASAVAWQAFHHYRTVERDVAQANREVIPAFEALRDLRHAGIRVITTSMELAWLARDGSLAQAQLEDEREEYVAIRALMEQRLQRCEQVLKGLQRVDTHQLVLLSRDLLRDSEAFVAGLGSAPPHLQKEAKGRFEASEQAFISLLNRETGEERKLLQAVGEGAIEKLDRARHGLQWGGGALLLVILTVGFGFARRLHIRITRLQDGVRRVGSGDFALRIDARGQDELGELGGEYNRMADHLGTTRQALLDAHGYLRGVVNSMLDGLVVLDAAGRVADANPAAVRMLGTALEVLQGAPLHTLCQSHSEGHLLERELEQFQGFPEQEVILVDAEGQEIHTLISASRIQGGDRQSFVCLLHNVSARKQAEARIANLSSFDQLTGLPNRTLLLERLEQALQYAAVRDIPLSLFLIDLDRFREINDVHGHETGDLLLQQIATRLSTVVRGTDTLARLGGDEFLLLCLGLEGGAHSSRVGEALLAQFKEPFQLTGHTCHVSASIGIAVFPDDGRSASILLRHADLAAGSSKAAGRSTFSYFSRELAEASTDRATLEGRLRQAILGNELHLAFQPLVNAQTGAWEATEALCRWTDPELGAIPPGRFIPVAEQTGLIRFLGDWVLQAACAQARRWERAGHPVRIWVNVSPAQLRKPEFPDTVAGHLRDFGLSPDLLGLEITEGLLMEQGTASAHTLRQIKAMGVALAIDDFGTGYSSLSYLQAFDVDKLKIDRSFVVGLKTGSENIIRAVVAMGHSLGFSITAEGVETAEEADLLRTLGCDTFQGYHFGRPMAAEAFEEGLRASRRA